MFASRFRAKARQKEHYTDKDIKRLHLYNCSWRFLGERRPHGGSNSEVETAGTYYWNDKKRWYTFDQIIVSGGMLTEEAPFLDEGSLEICVTPEVLGGESRPRKFTWENQQPRGVSDHLPIIGQIVVQTGE
jgi:hypothetical protein